MDRKLKTAKLAMVISLIAMLIAAGGFIFSVINLLSVTSAAIILSGACIIYYINGENYKKLKKNIEKSEKEV